LPLGRWRWPAVLLLGIAVLLLFLAAFRPTLDVAVNDGSLLIRTRNPLALFPDAAFWTLLPTSNVLDTFVTGELAIAPAWMLVRFIRSSGLERLQLRWLVAAVAFVTVSTLFGLLLSPLIGTAAWLPVAIGYPAIPGAITVAVLRYHLYDIGILVNRTVLYGSVTVLLAAVVGIANIGAQRLLEQLTHQRSELLTAGLAIGAAMAFTPVSRRLRPVVDRLLPSRALLTLLFMDIVGSTQKAVELGDARWRELLARYRSVVRRELAHYSGHEVDTAGDGFFATFEQADQAVECAVAVRAAIQRLGLEARIGLHSGECETRGEKVSGVAVHAAARVMAAADGGEILVSAAVRDAIPEPEFATTERGSRELKGLPGRWDLFALETA
ncbi:MAG: hypothetical protein M3P14_11010, partial [Chloroflexota bacterium]|nr:hypothetical protein [Chloroflexota bacterium]